MIIQYMKTCPFSYQSAGNEDAAQRLIKYRRVDNTFPKYMPNEGK